MVEVIGVVDLGFGGKARVDAGQLEQIECGYRLGNKTTPQME